MAIQTVGNTVTQGKPADGVLIANNSCGLRGLTTPAEQNRRIKALAERHGIGNEVVVRFEEPWSRKSKPVPKPKLPPTAPPLDVMAIEQGRREVATVEAVLAVHYRHQMPFDRAWRATTRTTGIDLPGHKDELRQHYENGRWSD